MRLRPSHFFTLSSLVCVFVCASAGALDTTTILEDAEGRAFLPAVRALLSRDSNILNTATDEVSSTISLVSPRLLWASAPASQRFAALYEGDYAHYFADSSNDYDDHRLSALGRFSFGSRGRLDLAAATEQGHRGRGTDQVGGLDPDNPLFPATPDTFDHNRWGARFRYGADGNRGRLRFRVGGDRRRHTNNLARTRLFDFETLTAGAGLSLKFHQRTTIVLDAEFKEIEFSTRAPNGDSRNGRDWRVLAGVTWAATGKTAGTVRVGVQNRRFDDPDLASATNPSWEVDVRWSPKVYSTVELKTARVNQEAFDDGTFIDSVLTELTWTHEWRRGYASIVEWRQNRLDFVNATRNQTIDALYVGLRLPRGKWLTWEAGYAQRSSRSGEPLFAYDGNMFSIGVNVAR